jgi:hypothetical protein
VAIIFSRASIAAAFDEAPDRASSLPNAAKGHTGVGASRCDVDR